MVFDLGDVAERMEQWEILETPINPKKPDELKKWLSAAAKLLRTKAVSSPVELEHLAKRLESGPPRKGRGKPKAPPIDLVLLASPRLGLMSRRRAIRILARKMYPKEAELNDLHIDAATKRFKRAAKRKWPNGKKPTVKVAIDNGDGQE